MSSWPRHSFPLCQVECRASLDILFYSDLFWFFLNSFHLMVAFEIWRNENLKRTVAIHDDNLYCNIYVYVCVCVCIIYACIYIYYKHVYMCIYIYILYTQTHARTHTQRHTHTHFGPLESSSIYHWTSLRCKFSEKPNTFFNTSSSETLLIRLEQVTGVCHCFYTSCVTVICCRLDFNFQHWIP